MAVAIGAWSNLDQIDSVPRKPSNVSWLGFTQDQARLLDFLDHLGNNGWATNSQTDALMPKCSMTARKRASRWPA